uniref:Cadherin-1 n=1 Tax=Fundulus heteroclitus TaxID=8078 RepID=A0A3Q2PLQ0_FUNHE
MGTIWFTVWCVLFFSVQASPVWPAKDPKCAPGFESKIIIFKVTGKYLRQGTELGKVNFTDCTDGTDEFVFTSDDEDFMVQTDGTLMVKRCTVLQKGQRNFNIYYWDSLGQEATASVVLQHNGDHEAAQSPQNNFPLKDFTNKLEDAADPQISIPEFAISSQGLKRRKREWLIPLNIVENHRGPFPQFIAQIRSDEAKMKTMQYSITGPGADQPPVGLFSMDKDNGNLYVTQELDREKRDKYLLQVHAVALGSTGAAEEPMDVPVNVIDQNDNKPVFNQSSYVAEVPEASPTGEEVIQVVATDADDPDSYNAIIRYRIISQEPEEPSASMFTIDPVTGAISVNASGLDREKTPQYTLRVQAADMEGEGMTGFTEVIIKVTDSNDNAPVVTDPSDAADPQIPILDFPISSRGLKRRKREWLIPPLNIVENHRGPFPLFIAQIRSDEDKMKMMHYSISGPGADQPPAGLFTIDTGTGNLYVTQELDREKRDKYLLQVHAVAFGSTRAAEEPMDVPVNVIDQNDNKPVFNQSSYVAEVPEASPTGEEVIQVVATDADDPDSYNAIIRYRIISQEPEEPSASMFTIDPVTGAISVNASGLDREKTPQYTLRVQAADMEGEGMTGFTEVIIKVTDSNDNAPVVTDPSDGADPQISILDFPTSSQGLKRKKRWIIPPLSIVENHRGPFPQFIAQICSDEAKMMTMQYSITGPGADQPPVGLFTMDKDTGNLYVTQELDREKRNMYPLQVHAVALGSTGAAEEPMDVPVNVIDQNDSKPVFNQSSYVAEVPGASPTAREAPTSS